MSYHTRTEFEAEVVIDSKTEARRFREILEGVSQDILAAGFSEVEMELEMSEDKGEIEFEVYDTSSYGKSTHYEIANTVISDLYEVKFGTVEVEHNTELIEQVEEDEDED